MNSKKIVKGVIGNAGMGKMTRDSDGDGEINVLDCKPHNKDEQGWFHDKYKAAKENVKQKYEDYKAESKIKKEEKAKQRLAIKEANTKRKQEEKEAKFIAQTKADEAARAEREKQMIETAKYKERQKGKAQRQSGGSGFAGFAKQFGKVSEGLAGKSNNSRVNLNSSLVGGGTTGSSSGLTDTLMGGRASVKTKIYKKGKRKYKKIAKVTKPNVL